MEFIKKQLCETCSQSYYWHKALSYFIDYNSLQNFKDTYVSSKYCCFKCGKKELDRLEDLVTRFILSKYAIRIY